MNIWRAEEAAAVGVKQPYTSFRPTFVVMTEGTMADFNESALGRLGDFRWDILLELRRDVVR